MHRSQIRSLLVGGLACFLILTAAPVLAQDSLVDWISVNGQPTPEEVKAIQNQTAAFVQPIPAGTVTTFTDRMAFEAMFPGLPLETFDNTGVGAGAITGCVAPFNNATTSAPCYNAGDLIPGFSIQDNPLNDAGGGSPTGVVVVGVGAFSNSTPTVAANTFVDSFDLIFDATDVTAVGGRLVTYTTEGNVNVEVYDTGDVLIDMFTAPATFDGTFLGISSPTPIGRINIFDPNGGAEGLDDLQFGAGTPQLSLTDGSLILDQQGFVETCFTNTSNVNGILEPGETITIAPSLSASGGDFTGVTGTLTTLDPNIFIVSGFSNYPDITDGSSAGPDVPFQFYLEQATPCESMISLDFVIASNEDSFDFTLDGDVGESVSLTGAGFSLPDNDPTGGSSDIMVGPDVALNDLDVQIVTTHTWVGDLIISLTGPDGTVAILDRPGVPASMFGCGDNNFDLTFDDDSAVVPEDICSVGNDDTPWLTGDAAPIGSLSTFTSTAGTWTLSVSDNAAGDTGTIDSWTLITDPAISGTCNICADPRPGTGIDFTEIPTLGEIGLMLLIALLGGAAVFMMRRR
ncbi:MAG: IPTL-CTERM sorting domain-containing protein [Acidobacteriota bacterium]